MRSRSLARLRPKPRLRIEELQKAARPSIEQLPIARADTPTRTPRDSRSANEITLGVPYCCFAWTRHPRSNRNAAFSIVAPIRSNVIQKSKIALGQIFHCRQSRFNLLSQIRTSSEKIENCGAEYPRIQQFIHLERELTRETEVLH